jgi:alkylhydroperoxidase family enzyme
MYGLSDEEIAAIREGRIAGFAAAEDALLGMADAMADTPSNLIDQLYGELRKHFSEEQLIEIAATAALENFRARDSTEYSMSGVMGFTARRNGLSFPAREQVISPGSRRRWL